MFKYLCVFIIIFSTYVYADVFNYPVENTKELEKHIYNPAAMSGKFHQTRFISSLNVTIRSEGEFAINKDSGIMWRNIKPIKNTTIIQNGKICTFVDGKSSSMGTENNALKEVMNIMNSIFTQDYDQLSKYFQLYFQEGEEFTLGLQTKDPIISNIIKSMVIKGNKYIARIDFSDQNGDETTLYFSDITENVQDINCSE